MTIGGDVHTLTYLTACENPNIPIRLSYANHTLASFIPFLLLDTLPSYRTSRKDARIIVDSVQE